MKRVSCDHDKPVFGCQGCITRATVPVAEDGTPMSLFRVTVATTYEGDFLVYAVDAHHAEEQAWDAEDHMDWVLHDTATFDAHARPMTTEPMDHDQLLADGAFVRWREPKKP